MFNDVVMIGNEKWEFSQGGDHRCMICLKNKFDIIYNKDKQQLCFECVRHYRQEVLLKEMISVFTDISNKMVK
ncbi:MAG: hypothetical protein WC783_00395 [Candidatus Paceibacterota bacterium]|jgi:hypothetical protein